MTQFRFWPALVAILIGLYIITTISIPDLLEDSLLPASLLLIVRFIVVRTSLNKMRAAAGSSQFRLWRFIGVGLLLWLFADMLWLSLHLYIGSPPTVPSVSQWLLMSGYIALISAVLAYPKHGVEYEGPVREVLDLLIISISILCLAWLTLLKPTLLQSSASLPSIFWSYVPPFLDFYILVLIARLLLIHNLSTGSRLPLFFSLAFLILGISDSTDAYRLIVRAPGPSELIWIGRMIATLLIGLVAYADESPAKPMQPSQVRSGSRWGSVINYFLPIALMLSATLIIFFDWWVSQKPDWFGVAGAGILALLMFARQGTIMGQQEMRQFKALVNATQDFAFICDQEGQLRMVNPALEDLLSRSLEEQGDLQLADFLTFPGSESEEFRSTLLSAAKSGWSGEVDLIRSDGSRFPALVSLSPFENVRWGGAFLAGTAHDLSPIRDREDRLRAALDEVDEAREDLAKLNAELELKVKQRTDELRDTIDDLAKLNEELKTLDQLKNEFVALVSHELRSPLTNIRSGIELVLDAGSDLDQATNDSLSLVQAEIHRLMFFVESILDLSALEAGRIHFDLIHLSVKKSAQEAYARLSPQEGLDRIELNIDDNLPDVLADERALGSVFFHLLDNSLKYAPEGSIEVTGREADQEVEIAIQDHGPGIPDAEQEKVFELFHRLDSSDAREVYGHGLGLPMVRRFVEAMGGGVRIDPSLKNGARIVFWLKKAV